MAEADIYSRDAEQFKLPPQMRSRDHRGTRDISRSVLFAVDYQAKGDMVQKVASQNLMADMKIVQTHEASWPPKLKT